DVERLSFQGLRQLTLVLTYKGGQSHHGTVLRLLEEALVRRPSDFRLARTLANRHIGAVPRKWPEAAHYLSIAMAVRPRNVYIQVSLAQVFRAQGKVEESKAALGRATRLEPSAARVHYLLGIAQANVFQMKEAAGEFREALRLRPDFLEAQYALARAASMSG